MQPYYNIIAHGNAATVLWWLMKNENGVPEVYYSGLC